MIGLTNKEIQQLAPAVFTETPHPRVSEKYVMINTFNVIDDMRDLGWYPCSAYQAKRKKYNGTQMHMIRFRQEQDIVNAKKEIIELLSINSHDGLKRLSFFSGVFRFICGNGVITMQHDFGGFSIKHINIDAVEIEAIINKHSIATKQITKQISEYKSIDLKNEQQLLLAKEIHEKINLKSNFPIESLLTIRRKEDEAPTLWNTFNVIQENVMNGGLKYQINKRNATTRKITSIQRDIKANVTMWAILNNFYNTYC